LADLQARAAVLSRCGAGGQPGRFEGRAGQLRGGVRVARPVLPAGGGGAEPAFHGGLHRRLLAGGVCSPGPPQQHQDEQDLYRSADFIPSAPAGRPGHVGGPAAPSAHALLQGISIA
ncbi:unnamed protein product, partial [Phaeothamnion confervicola]